MGVISLLYRSNRVFRRQSWSGERKPSSTELSVLKAHVWASLFELKTLDIFGIPRRLILTRQVPFDLDIEGISLSICPVSGLNEEI